MDTNPTRQQNTNLEIPLVSSAVLYNKNTVINIIQQEGVLTLTPSSLVFKSKSGQPDLIIPVSDIGSVTSRGIYIRIHPKNGRSHAFKFAAVAIENAILDGIDGLRSAKKQEAVEEKSDKGKWIEAFSKLGITVQSKSVAQANRQGTIIAVALVLLLALYQFVIAK